MKIVLSQTPVLGFGLKFKMFCMHSCICIVPSKLLEIGYIWVLPAIISERGLLSIF